jgi:hypothetical protein
VDQVKKLLTEFADRAVDGVPPADVDADVARGRRALLRIRARRRVAGVLCIAAAATAVLAIGNHSDWWEGETEVATRPGDVTPAVSPSKSEETMSVFAGPAAIELVPNKQRWSMVGCTLAPRGWTPEQPAAADRVVLTPPSARTSDEDKLVLRSAPAAQQLPSVRVIQTGGKVFQIGTAGGRELGQVQLGDRWLVVQLPVQHPDWTDDLLQRFMGSCSFS